MKKPKSTKVEFFEGIMLTVKPELDHVNRIGNPQKNHEAKEILDKIKVLEATVVQTNSEDSNRK